MSNWHATPASLIELFLETTTLMDDSLYWKNGARDALTMVYCFSKHHIILENTPGPLDAVYMGSLRSSDIFCVISRGEIRCCFFQSDAGVCRYTCIMKISL